MKLANSDFIRNFNHKISQGVGNGLVHVFLASCITSWALMLVLSTTLVVKVQNNSCDNAIRKLLDELSSRPLYLWFFLLPLCFVPPAILTFKYRRGKWLTMYTLVFVSAALVIYFIRLPI